MIVRTVKKGGADNVETKADTADDQYKLRLFHDCGFILVTGNADN